MSDSPGFERGLRPRDRSWVRPPRDNTQDPTRIGPNFVLPSMTGIAPATRQENFRVAKAKDVLPEGTFTGAVLGRHGDQADSFLG